MDSIYLVSILEIYIALYSVITANILRQKVSYKLHSSLAKVTEES